MTQLTDAPELVLLQDLDKGWRKVCHMEGVRHVWYGDLRNIKLRRVYQRMLADDAAIAVQYKIRDGAYVVFAKMADRMRYGKLPTFRRGAVKSHD